MQTAIETQPTILITGGTGFAGSHLVEELTAQGFTNLHVTSFGAQVNPPHPTAQIHTLDLTDTAAVNHLWQELQPTHIYHLASFAVVGNSFEKAKSVLQNNITLQLNVLEATRLHTPQARLLVIGSAEEYGVLTLQPGQKINEEFPLNPANPYAVSKVSQDLLAFTYTVSYKLDIVRARPFNHIGERQSPDFSIPSFAKQIVAIERGLQAELRVGELSGVRDFTDVKDMVKAYALLMAHGQAGEVYNIGSGTGYQMASVLEMMRQLAQIEVPIVTDPTKLRPLDVPIIIADNGKIAKLGWQPSIPLQQTLSRVLSYWREQA
ncbi:MAG TPA: GDP-mannose 4,6-dehydratase [Vitreimonas sp.]|nr:GDP-mannose 4,6-dehydratase [Vitreimonas sp.]